MKERRSLLPTAKCHVPPNKNIIQTRYLKSLQLPQSMRLSNAMLRRAEREQHMQRVRNGGWGQWSERLITVG